MNRFLLINNKEYFDKNNIITINKKEEVPNKNCILFLGSHDKSIPCLKYLQEYLNFIQNHKKNYLYIIIVGKTDRLLNNKINIPINIKYIFSNNINYNHPKIKFLPMGSDFRSISSFPMANINNKERPILCYCNFSLNTHDDRKKIFEMIKGKKSILFENMGKFLHYSISRDDFFKKINDSKFVICPRGAALDTFRFYDTIYGGSIPIVVKEEYHNSYFFNDIPILFLNKKEDFKLINHDFLEENYKRLSPLLKNYYLNLDFQTWMNKINNIMNNI